MATESFVKQQISGLEKGLAKQTERLENLQNVLLFLEKDYPEYEKIENEIKLVEGNIEMIRAVIAQNEERLKR